MAIAAFNIPIPAVDAERVVNAFTPPEDTRSEAERIVAARQAIYQLLIRELHLTERGRSNSPPLTVG